MGKQARSLLVFPEELNEDRDGSHCPDCKAPMELHQPDIHSPDRMLGICTRCHAWTLIRVGQDGRIHVTVLDQC